MTSLRFPPVSDTASGMPWASVTRWCLLPGRARSTGLGPPVGGIQQHGEGVNEVGRSGHLEAGSAGGLDAIPLVVLEAVGAGEQVAGEAPGRECGPVGLDAALVDVADEEVRAAGVAQFPDLLQEMGDGDGRVLQPASAQVIAAGVHEGGPVLGGADKALGLGHAVAALDGVESQVQAARALQKSDSALAQGVDLLPALAGGGGLSPLGRGASPLSPSRCCARTPLCSGGRPPAFSR